MSKVKGLLKRKMLFAALAAITVFAGVYGFAASLDVQTNELSAGNAAVASCQATQPTATYDVAYDSTLSGYKVSDVNVTNIDTGCNSKPILVTLTDSTNTSLVEMSGNTGTTGTVQLTPGSTIDAKSVDGISVAING
ncbi:MAG: hypothetical protein ACRDLK_06345 [Gaiellaceae bacterium]